MQVYFQQLCCVFNYMYMCCDAEKPVCCVAIVLCYSNYVIRASTVRKKIELLEKLLFPRITEETLLWYIRENYFPQFTIVASRFKQISLTA